MVTRKYKKGLKYSKGDEITFYQQGEIRTGIVCFVGSVFISVYPCSVEVNRENGEPLKEIEYNIEGIDII